MGKMQGTGQRAKKKRGRNGSDPYVSVAAPGQWTAQQAAQELASVIPIIPVPASVGTAGILNPSIVGRAFAAIVSQNAEESGPPALSVAQIPPSRSGRVVQCVQPGGDQGSVKMPWARQVMKVTVSAKGSTLLNGSASTHNAALTPGEAPPVSVGSKRKVQRGGPIGKKAKASASGVTLAPAEPAANTHVQSKKANWKAKAMPVGGAATADCAGTGPAGQKTKHSKLENGTRPQEQAGTAVSGAEGSETKAWRETAAALLERKGSAKQAQATASVPEARASQAKASKAKREAIVWSVADKNSPTAVTDVSHTASEPLAGKPLSSKALGSTQGPQGIPVAKGAQQKLHSSQGQQLPGQAAPVAGAGQKQLAPEVKVSPIPLARSASLPAAQQTPRIRQPIPVPGQAVKASPLGAAAAPAIHTAAPAVKRPEPARVKAVQPAAAAVAQQGSRAAAEAATQPEQQREAEANGTKKKSRQPIMWRPDQAAPAASPVPVPVRVSSAPAVRVRQPPAVSVAATRAGKTGAAKQKPPAEPEVAQHSGAGKLGAGLPSAGNLTSCQAGQAPPPPAEKAAPQDGFSVVEPVNALHPNAQLAKAKPAESSEPCRQPKLRAAPGEEPAAVSRSEPSVPAPAPQPSEAPAAPSSVAAPAEVLVRPASLGQQVAARPTEGQKPAHVTSSASENSAGPPSNHQPEQAAHQAAHCSTANSAEDDGEGNDEEELELDYGDDLDARDTEEASRPSPAQAADQPAGASEQAEEPESAESSLAVSGLESAGDDYWLDEDGEEQSSHQDKPQVDNRPSPSPRRRPSRSPPPTKGYDSLRACAQASPSHSGVQGKPMSGQSPERDGSNRRAGRNPPAETRHSDDGRPGRPSQEPKDGGRGRGTNARQSSRHQEDRAHGRVDTMPGAQADKRPSRLPPGFRQGDLPHRETDRERRATLPHRSPSPRRQRLDSEPSGSNRSGQPGMDSRVQVWAEQRHQPPGPTGRATIQTVWPKNGPARYQGLEQARPGAQQYGVGASQAPGMRARAVLGHVMRPQYQQPEVNVHGHPPQADVRKFVQPPDAQSRPPHLRAPEPAPKAWEHPPSVSHQGRVVPPPPPPPLRREISPGSWDDTDGSKPLREASSLLGWKIHHRQYTGLTGQVIYVVPDGEDHGGPWCIVRYENGDEEELDVAQTLSLLVGSKSEPLPPEAATSGLVCLQKLRVEPEPFGGSQPPRDVRPTKHNGRSGGRHSKPHPRAASGRGRGQARAMRRV